MDSNETRLTVGDLVTVAVPGVGGRIHHDAKARLVGWDFVPTIDGRRKRRPVVTYTSTTGEPFAVSRRVRGETETVPPAWVRPRGFDGDGIVVFVQGPQDVYRDAPPMARVKHGPNGTTTTDDISS